MVLVQFFIFSETVNEPFKTDSDLLNLPAVSVAVDLGGLAFETAILFSVH